MVEDVELSSYSLVSSEEDLSGRLEIGLQDFAGIIGMGAAIRWHKSYRPEDQDKNDYQKNISQLLFDKLAGIPTIKIVNSKSAPIVSFYSEKIDAHRLAIFLSSQNIMVRSGYFCCHYYLKNIKDYPPLVRVSIGLHNTEEQVEKFIGTLRAIVANV